MNIMSDELENQVYETETNEVYEPKRYDSKPIVIVLKIAAVVSAILSIIIAGMMNEMRGAWYVLPLIGGGFSVVWWRFCAKVAEAVEKYLDE